MLTRRHIHAVKLIEPKTPDRASPADGCVAVVLISAMIEAILSDSSVETGILVEQRMNKNKPGPVL